MQHEIRITRLDGEPRWIRIAGSPVTDEHGTVIRIADTVEDVTLAKNAGIALRESEERFRRTASSLQVGISLRQIEPAKFLYVNDKYVQIIGFDPTLMKGAPVESALQRIHPDDRDGVMADYWQRAATGQPAQAEMRIVQPSGEIRWLGFTTHPVQPEPGTPALAAGTIEDITVRKIAEAALQSARRDAERANRAKSEFLSRMSHELRTPLNAILGFAQLLELDDLSTDQSESVALIRRAGTHLLDLINEVLDISRVESGNMPLSVEPVGLRQVIEESLELVSAQARARGITVAHPDLSSCDAVVRADAQRLKQVMVNLLSNAVKYNRIAGRIDIDWSMVRDRVQVRVRDTGPGVPEQLRHRVFVPFDRLGAEHTDIEGSGVGLALS